MPRNQYTPEDLEPIPSRADRDDLDPDTEDIGRAHPARHDRDDDDGDDELIGRADSPVYEDDHDGDGDLDRPPDDRARTGKRSDPDAVEEIDLDELEAYDEFGPYDNRPTEKPDA